jgi:recombination protein RecR
MNKLMDDAVNEFAKLPGIGRRSALRMVLHLLKETPEEVRQFSAVITRLREEIKYCNTCYNIAEGALCSICTDKRRDTSLVCVVESIRDIIAIENTQQFRGVYHVLGGIISPIDGIGPGELNVESFVERIRSGSVQEIIMALSSTMEGDTTVFYLYRRIKEAQGEMPIKVSTIARGISVGDELEYADELTLGRSILQRVPYENSLMR